MKLSRITLIILLVFIGFGATSAQDFKIVSNNIGQRRNITDSVKSGDFVIGVNRYGGGYITQIEIPGVGNIMGFQAQRFGRGGQSSIRDMGRGGRVQG